MRAALTEVDDIRSQLGMLDALSSGHGSATYRAERVRDYVILMMGKKRFKATMANVNKLREELENQLKEMRPVKQSKPVFRSAEPEKDYEQKDKQVALQKRHKGKSKKVARRCKRWPFPY